MTNRLLKAVEGKDQHAALRATLEESRYELLVAACARASAEPGNLASLARIERQAGKTDQARDLYRRLLGKDPVSRERYSYARLLADEGSIRDARRELRDLLTYHPDHTAAQRLLTQLESGDQR